MYFHLEEIVCLGYRKCARIIGLSLRIIGVPSTGNIPSATPNHGVLTSRIRRPRIPVIVTHIVTEHGLGVLSFLDIVVVIALLGGKEQTVTLRCTNNVVLHIMFILNRERCAIRRLITLHTFCHLSPWAKFVCLAQREGRFRDILHRIQLIDIHLVDILHREWQVVVINTQVHCVSLNRFILWRIEHRRLSGRVFTGIIVLRRHVEDGITSLGH